MGNDNSRATFATQKWNQNITNIQAFQGLYIVGPEYLKDNFIETAISLLQKF